MGQAFHVQSYQKFFEYPKSEYEPTYKFRDGDPGLEEAITKMKIEAAQANSDDLQAKRDAMRAIGGNIFGYIYKYHLHGLTLDDFLGLLWDAESHTFPVEESLTLHFEAFDNRSHELDPLPICEGVDVVAKLCNLNMFYVIVCYTQSVK